MSARENIVVRCLICFSCSMVTDGGDWKVLYFYHNFIQNEENCRKFPFLMRVLEKLGPDFLGKYNIFCSAQAEHDRQLLFHYWLPFYTTFLLLACCLLSIPSCRWYGVLFFSDAEN